MRDALLVVLVPILLVATIAWLMPKQSQQLPTFTPSMIVCDPDSLLDQKIRVRTKGMQPGDKTEEIVYRKLAGQKPSLVCILPEPLKGPIPPLVTGICLGAREDGIVVVDCR